MFALCILAWFAKSQKFSWTKWICILRILDVIILNTATNLVSFLDSYLQLWHSIFVGRFPLAHTSKIYTCKLFCASYTTSLILMSWYATSLLCGSKIKFQKYQKYQKRWLGLLGCDSTLTLMTSCIHNSFDIHQEFIVYEQKRIIVATSCQFQATKQCILLHC